MDYSNRAQIDQDCCLTRLPMPKNSNPWLRKAYDQYSYFHQTLSSGWYVAEIDGIPRRLYLVTYDAFNLIFTLTCFFVLPYHRLEMPTLRPVHRLNGQANFSRTQAFFNTFRETVTPMAKLEFLNVYFFSRHGYIIVNHARQVLWFIDGRQHAFRYNQDVWVCVEERNSDCSLCDQPWQRGAWFRVNVTEDRCLFVYHRTDPQNNSKQLKPLTFEERETINERQSWIYQECYQQAIRRGSQLTCRIYSDNCEQTTFLFQYNKYVRLNDCMLQANLPQLTC